MRRLTAAILLLLVGCTGQAAPPDARDAPVSSPTQEPQPPPTVTVRLVAGDDPSLASYEEGVRFAVEEVASEGDLTLRLLEGPSVGAAVGLGPAAVIVIGDADAVAEARPEIEVAQVPVVLIGGDLYSSRELFRYAFQTSVPYRWQARITARYLVADRGYDSIAVVGEARLGTSATDEMVRALGEEGTTASSVTSITEATASEAVDAAAAASADAILFQGGTATAAALSRELERLADPPQLALSAEALDASFVAGNQPPTGTVACYTYAWSGWADMLPRVHAFREAFADAVGNHPASLEQEGHDALMTLADALVRTAGEGGDALVRELETFRDETYSSVPVRLGPDDHVLAEESHLGLFAVEEPIDAALPPGEASSLLPWRPILRTFTTDGEKVNFLDRDKRIFFPFWRPKRPTPKYWRSEYGIVSRPSDPLH